jgi:hypothetical protein
LKKSNPTEEWKIASQNWSAACEHLRTLEDDAGKGTVFRQGKPVEIFDAHGATITGTVDDALKLQRPAPDGTLKIVATGEKEDVARTRSPSSGGLCPKNDVTMMTKLGASCFPTWIGSPRRGIGDGVTLAIERASTCGSVKGFYRVSAGSFFRT